MSLKEGLGTRIKGFRKGLGLKSITVARESDISVGYLCDIESNRTSPSIRTLKRIASSMKTTVGFLLGESDPKNNSLGGNEMTDGEKQYQEVKSALADYVLRVLEESKEGGGIFQPDAFATALHALIPLLERER